MTKLLVLRQAHRVDFRCVQQLRVRPQVGVLVQHPVLAQCLYPDQGPVCLLPVEHLHRVRVAFQGLPARPQRVASQVARRLDLVHRQRVLLLQAD